MSDLNPRTHVFVLIRNWIKTGKLSERKSYELIERIEEMAHKTTSHPVERLETKIDSYAKSQNRIYYLLIWAIGFATVILSGVMIFTRNG